MIMDEKENGEFKKREKNIEDILFNPPQNKKLPDSVNEEKKDQFIVEWQLFN